MVKAKQDIINDITDFFSGIAYKGCYVGITKDVKSSLFGDHDVSEKGGTWIYRTASSDSAARDIEQHFFVAGMDGDGGGGDEESKIVYAYKKISVLNL
jgi:hypothetical protein